MGKLNLSERLKKARKEALRTQRDVANAIGLAQPTLSQLENGILQSSAFIPKIAKYLGVDSYWLATGEGEMYSTASQSSNVTNKTIKIETYKVPLDEAVIPILPDIESIDSKSEIIAPEHLKLMRHTLHGSTVELDEVVAIRTIGKTMNPTIQQGDLIYIDLSKRLIKDGKIFAICHGGIYTLARLYKLPMGGARLVYDNINEFPEVHLTAQQIIEQEFRILGWVWQISSLDTW